MGNIFKSALAAAVLSASAIALVPSPASAGVMGATDKQSVAPASATESIHWRRYCHRHYRHHWVYYGYAYPYRYYGYAYPYRYGYYGYANPVGAAVGLATWPFWGWW